MPTVSRCVLAVFAHNPGKSIWAVLQGLERETCVCPQNCCQVNFDSRKDTEDVNKLPAGRGGTDYS